MKAAIVHSFDQPLALEDVPMPEAGPEQVLVRIEVGLCHTDIHAARGRTRIERELEDVNDAVAQVLDGSAPAPHMVFLFGEVPIASDERTGIGAIA